MLLDNIYHEIISKERLLVRGEVILSNGLQWGQETVDLTWGGGQVVVGALFYRERARQWRHLPWVPTGVDEIWPWLPTVLDIGVSACGVATWSAGANNRGGNLHAISRVLMTNKEPWTHLDGCWNATSLSQHHINVDKILKRIKSM